MTLARLARWCYRLRWRVLIAWIVVLVGLNVLSSVVGSAYNSSFSGELGDCVRLVLLWPVPGAGQELVVDAVIVGEAVHQDDRWILAGNLGDVDPPVGRLHEPFVSLRDGGCVV